MATFQDTRKHTEQKVIVQLFTEIERNPNCTQRSLAAELGIALGLMNQYLKRCMTKGWIRASQVSPKRIKYFLTAEGFKEKSHMVANYLSRSLTFFRDSRLQCEELFALCKQYGWKKIALLGDGDLADIARLVANGTDLDLHLANLTTDLKQYDAIIVTDITNPQGTYDSAKKLIETERVLTLKLLHISITNFDNEKVFNKS